VNDVTLPGEQQVALRTAYEHGYYDTPRDATLEELATALDVPRSTLSYRLRRAEAQLVRNHVEGPAF
jgi:predicted DNA binding protein